MRGLCIGNFYRIESIGLVTENSRIPRLLGLFPFMILISLKSSDILATVFEVGASLFLSVRDPIYCHSRS